MKKYLATILLAMLAHVSVCAAQNPGNFPAGYVYGNNTAATRQPSAASLTSMFDRAFCSTNNATNVRISGTWVCLTSANNAVWATNGSGVPALTQTLPNAVQDNITRLGSVTSGSLHIATVTGLAAPTLASDAATKDYVDSTAAGRVYHPAALVATATGVVLPNAPTYSNGASGVGATLTAGANAVLVVDGTTVSVVGTTVLVKGQASALQNGEYTLTTAGVAGGGGNPWVLTRDTSMDAPAEMAAGETVFVQTGSTNANTSWTLSAAVTTVGTSPVTFVNTGGAGNNTWGISGTDIFNNNAGNVLVNTNIAVTGYGSFGSAIIGSYSAAWPFQIGAAKLGGADIPSQVSILDTLAYNTSPVSGIMLGGKYNIAGDIAGFGGIVSGKENATDGNYAGYLAFYSRTNGLSAAERVRIDSNGNVKINNLAGSGVGCPSNDNTGTIVIVAIACNPSWGDPTGVVSSNAQLTAAYGYINRIILPPAPGGTSATYKLSSNTTWPNGVEWIIPCGSIIRPDSGITVRIRGRVTANHQCQIFDHSAGGTVTGVREGATPEMWGALNNGSSGDDSVPINAANASVLEGAQNSSDGFSLLKLLSGSGYFVANPVTFSPTLDNALRVEGAGRTKTSIIGATAGTFARGIVTIAGATTAGGKQIMDFYFKDFGIRSESSGTNVQCLTIGTVGGYVEGVTQNKIENLYLTNCLTLMGIYEARLIRFDRMALWMPDSIGARAIIVDPGTNGSASAEGMDWWGGQIVCGASGASAASKGIYGIFMKSSVPGNGVSAMRFHGFTWYYCARALYLLADGGVMGDFWIDSGSQCDACSTFLYAQATQATPKSIVNINVDHAYTTANSTNNAIYEFKAAATTDKNGITDVHISNGRHRGSKGRLLFSEGGMMALNLHNNQTFGFQDAGLGNEIIRLDDVVYGTITANTSVPDGIPSAVPYFVGCNGATNVITIVGNTFRGAATSTNSGSCGTSPTIANNTQ